MILKQQIRDLRVEIVGLVDAVFEHGCAAGQAFPRNDGLLASRRERRSEKERRLDVLLDQLEALAEYAEPIADWRKATKQ